MSRFALVKTLLVLFFQGFFRMFFFRVFFRVLFKLTISNNPRQSTHKLPKMSKEPKKNSGSAQKKRKANPPSSSKVCDDDQLLSCPVCLDPFTGKIFQCQNGHVLCPDCIDNVRGICPSCRGHINKTIRNLIAEQLAQKAPTGCGFKNCNFVGPRSEIKKHHKICERRPLKCPIGECVWRYLPNFPNLPQLLNLPITNYFPSIQRRNKR